MVDDIAVDPNEPIDMEDGTIVSGDSRDAVGVNDVASPDNKATDSSSEDAKTPDADVPFHEHPRFREVTRQNREYRDKLESLQGQQQELMGRLNQMNQQSPMQNQNATTYEQQAAAQQLKEILFPGIDITGTLNSIKHQTEELNRQRTNEAFDQEEKQLISKIKDYGLAKDSYGCDEIKDKLEDHIRQHPILNQMKDKPGVWGLAFNDLYSNHANELGERAANKKLIENQEKAKASLSETSSNTGSSGGIKLTGNTVNDFADLVKRAGGEEAIDMNS